jgi:endonuclease YncB( thermonuclease family)
MYVFHKSMFSWTKLNAGILATSLLFLGPSLLLADTLTGRVIKISDGDTITVLDSSFNQHKIRLSGIDVLESGQTSALVRSSI